MIYPCGCSFDIFTSRNDYPNSVLNIESDFEFEVEAFEPCEQHRKILVEKYNANC